MWAMRTFCGNFQRLFVLACLVTMVTMVTMLTHSSTALAQGVYPSRPIRFITPYVAGGSTSLMARLVGQHLTERWGQNVIVDNRPGGNTVIGTEALARAAPDGYTIMLATSTHAILSSLTKTPYDPIKDFAPVASIGIAPQVLVLNMSVPANTVQEVIALAKAKPGQLNFGSSGAGGPTHLSGELFNMLAGVKTQHIPYKGAAPVVIDLIGGQNTTLVGILKVFLTGRRKQGLQLAQACLASRQLFQHLGKLALQDILVRD